MAMRVRSREKDPIKRFWSHVDKTPGYGPKGTCWIWTKCFYANGYGKLGYDGKIDRAHRIAWMLTHGAFPESPLCVLHKCDFRACCRPSHLFSGTRRDNAIDRTRKGRSIPRKLTLEQAKVVRIEHARGTTVTALAQTHGVSYGLIQHLLAGRTYVVDISTGV